MFSWYRQFQLLLFTVHPRCMDLYLHQILLIQSASGNVLIHPVFVIVCRKSETSLSADRSRSLKVLCCCSLLFLLKGVGYFELLVCRPRGLPVNESDLLTVKRFHPQNVCTAVLIYFFTRFSVSSAKHCYAVCISYC